MAPYHAPAAPDEEGEGPGRYGVCCDRGRGDTCMCDGEPTPGFYPTHATGGQACTAQWIFESEAWRGDPFLYPGEPNCKNGDT
tara:strand:- start:192 stop:440 length:249 start_codon:yes stop_codon:yes gene_type:complete